MFYAIYALIRLMVWAVVGLFMLAIWVTRALVTLVVVSSTAISSAHASHERAQVSHRG